jgi:tryptophanyl-tRNA synthetase
MKSAAQKIVLSGIQPTGIPHIGNYLGALREWSAISKDATTRSYFSLMDLHAITVPKARDELRKDIFDGACTLLACGIKPSEHCSIFVQSQVPQHLELYWILQSLSSIGQLKRMTQFKDKTLQHKDQLTGLLVYPVLMAADILVYGATHVPVGEDQVQHLELCRDLTDTYNSTYLPSAPLRKPSTVLNADTKKIMSLASPEKKMSKSELKTYSRVIMTDHPDVIRKKISRAVTDSLGAIDPASVSQRRGIYNLILILSACSNKAEAAVIEECAGLKMVDFKSRVTDAVISVVDPVRMDIERLRDDRAYVHSVLKKGKEEATAAAEKTMKNVREDVGFIIS